MLTLDRPRDRDLHTLADFAELLCLVSLDRVVSVEDFRDYLFDEANLRLEENVCEDTFLQIGWRSSAFGVDYPFKIATNGQSFSASEDLSEQQTAYALLLMCANLPFIPRDSRQGLTDSFERAAHCALKRIWPTHGVVRPFGKNNTDYTGTKIERLTALGINLGCRPNMGPRTFRPGDSGDGGIDLAAWVELDQAERENIPSALAQCACSRDDWSRKQAEISNGRLASLLSPRVPWLEFVCIPISFRDNNGRWAVEAEVHQSIVIDRLRLLRFLSFPEDWATIDPPAFFRLALETRLDLV